MKPSQGSVPFAATLCFLASPAFAFQGAGTPSTIDPATEEPASCIEIDQKVGSLKNLTKVVKDTYIDGFLRSYYESSSDPDPDQGGWRFEQLRINVNGQIEDLKWRVSWELNSGTAKLKDAWVKWKLSKNLGSTWGQFKRPTLYSFKLCGGFRLMVLPTLNASNLKRDKGAMIIGHLPDQNLHWALAALNGADAQSDDLNLIARVRYDYLGKGAYSKFEGAIDAPKNFVGSVAVSYSDDQNDAAGGGLVAIDSVLQGKGMFFHAEMVDYDTDFMANDKTTGKALSDTTTLSLTASYMLAPNKEMAIRFEDWDDLDDTTRATVGFNYYHVLPHKVKWSLNFSDLSSDDGAIDKQTLTAGLTINI